MVGYVVFDGPLTALPWLASDDCLLRLQFGQVRPMQRVPYPGITEQQQRRRIMWFARLLLEGQVIRQPWKALQVLPIVFVSYRLA